MTVRTVQLRAQVAERRDSETLTPLICGTVLNPLNSSMIAPTLVPIAAAFAAPMSQAEWLIAALYLATAVGQPTMGRLADRFGPRRVQLAGFVSVVLGCIGAALAPSLGFLIAMRVLIGIGTSSAYPAAMTTLRRRSERLGKAVPKWELTAIAVVSQISLVIGPTLSGVILAFKDWRWTFLASIPIAVAGFVLALAWLEPDAPREDPAPLWNEIDAPSIILFAAGMLCAIFFSMNLTAPQWWLIALAVAFFAALIVVSLRRNDPFIDVRMLVTNGALTRTYMRSAATSLIFYVELYGFAQWLEQARGLSPATTGLVMLATPLVAMFCASVFASRQPTHPSLIIGTAVLTVACIALAFATAATPPMLLVAIAALFGIPNGLIGISNQTALYRQVPAQYLGTASGLFRTFQYLGAILSSSALAAAFGTHATDARFHGLVIALACIGLITTLGTIFDRSLAKE